jgi:hypothetical protein
MLDTRLKRITDLFIEGRVAEFGIDPDGVPVLVWVNKPNSFEEEEARRDGLAARTEHLLELKDDTHPDIVNARSQLHDRDIAALIEARVNQKYDEDFVGALNELESDKEWTERLEYLRRFADLLNDAAVPEDDPRRARYAEVTREYQAAMTAVTKRLQDERRKDLADVSRDELVEDYLNDFREREAFSRFLAEKRITEIFYALRDCQGTKKPTGGWDHSNCEHRNRLLVSRSDVRSLPQGVIETAISVLEGMTATPRESGNSDAPASSSASSEQPSAAEESTPSSPVETPTGVRLI